jgi:voltage-gated potassium channel
MLDEAFVAILLVAGTVGIHAVGTTLLLRHLAGAVLRIKDRLTFVHRMILTASTALFLLSLHVCEVVLWAVAYSILPGLESLRAFPDAVYFSCTTFTTLGYGDITIVGKWRFLSGVEAMNGILLFGWSTAMLFALIQHLWHAGHPSRFHS